MTKGIINTFQTDIHVSYSTKNKKGHYVLVQHKMSYWLTFIL